MSLLVIYLGTSLPREWDSCRRDLLSDCWSQDIVCSATGTASALSSPLLLKSRGSLAVTALPPALEMSTDSLTEQHHCWCFPSAGDGRTRNLLFGSLTARLEAAPSLPSGRQQFSREDDAARAALAPGAEGREGGGEFSSLQSFGQGWT